ncbi:MAG: NAD(P)/FAD-dependent oxidoreductase [Ancalomicrobiaceae bacterium]|nr:NAD(P)/FAD-dependent oxidoreductase [Ancalomicrobiaceae bacterium]
MKTVLVVKLAFLPILLYGLITAFGSPALALDVGAGLAVVQQAASLMLRRYRPMEAAIAIGLAGLSLAAHLRLGTANGWPDDPAMVALPVIFLLEAATGFATCIAGQPWTSAYAGASYGSVRRSALFHTINMVLSAMWSALFVVFAALAFFHIGGRISEILTLAGLVISVAAPPVMVWLMLKRSIDARETWRWREKPLQPRSDAGPDRVDVAVIGTGLGGLTAAALLADAGLKVFIADQHVVPGGFCQHFVRKVRHQGQVLSFRFDGGVHDISGVWPGGTVSGILGRLGARLDWARVHQSAWLDGGPFPVAEDWHEHIRRLGERYPASAEGLQTLFSVLKEIFDGMMAVGDGHYGVALLPETTAGLMDYARKNPTTVAWLNRPFADLVAEYVSERRAAAAVSALTGYITDRPEELTVAEMAPLFGYYFHGGHYPMGGSGKLAEVLADAITARGGEVALKSPVAEILTDTGRAIGVRLASGRRIAANAVISNADARETMLRLLPASALRRKDRARFETAEAGTSAFMVHLGVSGPLDIAPIASARSEDGLEVGVTAPSIVDPSAAPEGYSTLELIALVPQTEAKRWFATEVSGDAEQAVDVAGDADGQFEARRSSNDYLATKSGFGDRLIAAAEHLIPDLRERIVYRLDASPVTFARYAWTSGGSIYGMAKGSRVEGTKSPVRGLYLAGSVNLGPGVEAAMLAGARTAQAIRPGLLDAPQV